MSPTTDQSSCQTPTFNVQSYQSYFHQNEEVFAAITLLGGLYGVLATLSVISCYALLERRSGKIQSTPIFMCLTILALFTSTTIYVVTCVLYYQATFMVVLVCSARVWFSGFSTPAGLVETPDVLVRLIVQRFRLQACASAGTLTVNVVLGDAIVCWRACVIWRENRVVKAICGVFIAATFVLGVLDAHQGCGSSDVIFMWASGGTDLGTLGTLFEGVPVGLATCALSLCTNILATLLVAYKAWQSRARLKGYLVAKVGGSQLEKLLSLLIESGAIYSAIWSVVVAFQVSQYMASPLTVPTDATFALESNFIQYFGVIMNGALVPAIAIYPTIIIVLVAFNRSHVERGISQHLESMPTLDLALTVNTTNTGLHESHSFRRSEVLVFDRSGLGCGDGLEDTARRMSKERKAEGAV